MNVDDLFRAMVIDKNSRGDIHRQIRQCTLDDLPPGDVLIKVDFSSLNYKDALGVMGHPGIVRHYPHVPGIDAAGDVAASNNPNVPEGARVLVTGFGLGTETWGGFAEYIRVPAEWVMLVPREMSTKESMSIGTAGLTAALCVEALLRNGVIPTNGEVLVSGATGGVGSIATAILAKLGYKVVALTRKTSSESYLEQIGVSKVINHEQLAKESERHLCKEEWAAAVDTLGGTMLASILKRIRYGGFVAACGMASGTEFATSVFPFILRGVNLLGIDSVRCPILQRKALWDKLATEWKVSCLENITQTIRLDDVGSAAESLLAGERLGRTIVSLEYT
jgi:putative YhdH/YhfP family quinone oxidoreductase